MQHAAAEGAKPPSFLSLSLLRPANRADAGARFRVGHPLSTRLHHPVGLALRSEGADRHDRPDERAHPRLQVQIPVGAVSRPLRCARLQPPPGTTAGMDRRFSTWSDGCAGRGRLRRSGALACLDGGVFARARLRGSHSGRGDRWLAHQCRAGQSPGADGLMVGGRLSGRRPRRWSRRAPARGSGRMARRLPLHGSLDDARHARCFLRPRAGVGQDRDAGAAELSFQQSSPRSGN